MRTTHALSLSALSLALACGKVAPPDAYQAPPLLTLAATVDGAVPDDVTSLKTALVWTAFSETALDCIASGGPGCGVLFEPRITAETIPLEPIFPAAVEMPLFELPSSDALSVADGGKLGLGMLTVFRDGNANDALDIAPPGTYSPEDEVLGHTTVFDDWGYAVEQTYVVYREGGLTPLWELFEVFWLCGEPPEGFSIVTLREIDDEPYAECVISPADTPIDVRLDDSLDTRELICAADADAYVYTFPDAPIPVGAYVQCEGDTAFYSTSADALCPDVERYDLIGCDAPEDEAACRASLWDLRDSPPSWWPCRSDNALRMLATAWGTPTADRDLMITFEVRGGSPLYRIEDTTGFIEIDEEGHRVLLGEGDIVLVDHDGNGGVSVGDEVQVYEPAGSTFFGPDLLPGNYPLQLTFNAELPAAGTVSETIETFLSPLELPTPPYLSLSARQGDSDDVIGILTHEGNIQGEVTELEVDRISLRMYVFGEIPTSVPRQAWTHVDHDGDGTFSLGDEIEVRRFEVPDIEGAFDTPSGHHFSLHYTMGFNYAPESGFASTSG